MSAFQLLNGATFGALLFVVASGFTLIFGLLRIVNLSHGALYLGGGYIGFSTAVHTGSFALAGSAAILAVAFLGVQFHYCADLRVGPKGSHICPLCSTTGSAVTPVAPNIAIAPLTDRLAVSLIVVDVSPEIRLTVSSRAPPAV